MTFEKVVEVVGSFPTAAGPTLRAGASSDIRRRSSRISCLAWRVSVSELVERELLLPSGPLRLLALEPARVLVGRNRLAVVSHLGPSGGQLEIREH